MRHFRLRILLPAFCLVTTRTVSLAQAQPKDAWPAPLVSHLEALLAGSLPAKERPFLDDLCKTYAPVGDDVAVLAPEHLLCFVIRLDEASRKRKAPPPESHRRPAPLPVPTSSSEWLALSQKDFTEAFRTLSLPTIDSLELAVSSCPLTVHGIGAAAAALLARAEELLPESRVFDLMERLYRALTPLLLPHEEGFERAHLRMGLLRISRGNLAGAAESLQLAQTATSPREPQRAHFWAGAIEMLTRAASASESDVPQAWERLIAQYPLDLHALVAAHALGRDPLARLTDAAPGAAPHSKSEPPHQPSLQIFAILQERNRPDLARTWAGLVLREIEIRDPALLLELANASDKVGAHLEAFSFLHRALRLDPALATRRRTITTLFPKPFADAIHEFGGHRIDSSVLFGLIRQESAFQPTARSIANARGLMQLLPGTAKRFVTFTQDSDLYEPTMNIRAGTRYFEELLEKNGGSFEYALAAYNAGPTVLARWKARFPGLSGLLFADLIPYRETRHYVGTILRNAYWYQRLPEVTAQTRRVPETAPTWAPPLLRSLTGPAGSHAHLEKILESSGLQKPTKNLVMREESSGSP